MEQGWHPQDIIAAMRKRGSTLASLGRECGFAYATMYKALTHRFPNVHSVIAHALGETRHRLWPQWYDCNDVPLLKTRHDLIRKQPFSVDVSLAPSAVLERAA